jgi:hypothetical protein
MSDFGHSTVARPGDKVTIVHTGRPISKWKSFRLLEIDRRGKDRALYPEIEEGKAVIMTEMREGELEGLTSRSRSEESGRGEVESGPGRGAGKVMEAIEALRDTPELAEGRI